MKGIINQNCYPESLLQPHQKTVSTHRLFSVVLKNTQKLLKSSTFGFPEENTDKAQKVGSIPKKCPVGQRSLFKYLNTSEL